MGRTIEEAMEKAEAIVAQFIEDNPEHWAD
jgi:hypothetical protein